MEAIEFWVLIGKKLGLSLDDFQDIKNISLKNYKNIQDRLNDAQNCLRSGTIKNQSDINYIENYLIEYLITLIQFYIINNCI